MSLPYTLVPISEEEKSARAKLFTGPKTCMIDMVVAEPYGMYLPKKFETIAEEIYNMKIRSDDVFMISFPKAGATWNQVNNDLQPPGLPPYLSSSFVFLLLFEIFFKGVFL